jgi:FAD/FMN-containing dehydrogenase
VRADAGENADLFWALRGGGGSFGVVTAIEFRLYPLTDLYGGALFFPVDQAAAVVADWRRWVETVPAELTSAVKVFHFPPFDEIPEPFRGKSFAIVEVAFQGSDAAGDELVQPLRALQPVLDTVGRMPATALTRLHMDPDAPVPYAGDGLLLADVPAEEAARIVSAMGPELLGFELRHLGGAAAQSSPEHGVADRLDAPFAFFTYGMAPTPEAKLAVEAAARRFRESLAHLAAEKTYFNFTERPVDESAFHHEDAASRLRLVRAQHDPGRLFAAGHEVGR